jgi:hypothetical protein
VVLAQASVTIEVFPGAADSDGDGISNAEEIARGWDPFTPNLPPVTWLPWVWPVLWGQFFCRPSLVAALRMKRAASP